MGWRMDSSAGAAVWDTETMSEADRLCRDEELNWLVKQERRGWKLINGRIANSGAPTAMAEGTYGALAAYPIPAEITGPTLSTTEQLLISAANIAVYTPMLPNSMLSPQAWHYVVAGRYTVGATPGTVASTMRLGNAITSPSLGASAAVSLTALTAAFFYYWGVVTVGQLGAPGTNSKAFGNHNLHLNTAVGGAFNGACWGTGTTAASFDSTIALGTNGGGFNIGVIDAGATNHATLTLQQVVWGNWN